jgi:UDP-N-acetylmuramyl pentapeptide phosphotransferase/UDP-N-acetylglucosamine-1-phosphate transferase
MFLFAGFVSYWFHFKLEQSLINFRPFAATINLGSRGYMILTFFMTLTITNAINITDGLD